MPQGLDTLQQRLFNYVENNAQINHFEVGHVVDTAAKAHNFVFCEPVSFCQLLAELSCQSDTEDDHLNNVIKRYQKTKGTEFFFSVVEFYGHSGRLISKRVCNTGRRANK